MAKKSVKEKSKNDNTLEKRFGENLFVSGRYLSESTQVIVPVSPMIDSILGGGIPFGSFVIATGRPKLGKTSLSLDMAGSALGIPTEFDKERKLFFFNIEGRLNPRDLKGISGLRPYLENPKLEKRVISIGSSPGDIITAEKFLEIGEAAINENPGSIFIFDSFSQMCSKEGYDHEWDGKGFRDPVPKFLSSFCKRICNVIPINKSIVVGITHQIADTGFGFSSWAEASGNKIQYAVDVKLKATHCTPWMENENKIGQDVHWECFCSPLHNGPTELKCASKLRFGYGIDKPAEIMNVAVDLGTITKGGSWYTFPDGTKCQGYEKAVEILRENTDLYNEINIKYREMMGFPC